MNDTDRSFISLFGSEYQVLFQNQDPNLPSEKRHELALAELRHRHKDVDAPLPPPGEKIFSKGEARTFFIRNTSIQDRDRLIAMAQINWPDLSEASLQAAYDEALNSPHVPKALGRSLIIRTGDQITPEKIEWIWKPVLPVGGPVHFGGESAQAKSPVTVDIAARMTAGAPWPVGEGRFEPRHVLMLNVEDRAEDTILPRFLLAGGNPKMLTLLEGTRIQEKGKEFDAMVALDRDFSLIAEQARKMTDLGLIIIDPITNYLGAMSMNKEEEVRSLLMPLAKLAQELRICIINVGHHNKNESQNPLKRMMGAAAFVGVARQVFSFGPDNDAESKYCHIMAPCRGALGGSSFKYRTEVDENDTVRVIWDGTSTASAEDTVKEVTQDEKRQVAEAADLIADHLKPGEKSAQECEHVLKQAGFGELNTGRIRRKAGVGTRKGKGKDAGWFWYLKAEPFQTVIRVCGPYNGNREVAQ
jgi:AAA domain